MNIVKITDNQSTLIISGQNPIKVEFLKGAPPILIEGLKQAFEKDSKEEETHFDTVIPSNTTKE